MCYISEGFTPNRFMKLQLHARVQVVESLDLLKSMPLVAGSTGMIVDQRSDGLLVVQLDGYSGTICLPEKLVHEMGGIGKIDITGCWVIVQSGRYRGMLGSVIGRAKVYGHWSLRMIGIGGKAGAVIVKRFNELEVVERSVLKRQGVLFAAEILIKLMHSSSDDDGLSSETESFDISCS